jgi:hypothetical protein
MQPETKQQQYNNVVMEPSPKGGFNWKRFLLFVLVAIIAAALSGVSVWGYMSNQNNTSSKAYEAQITTKNTKITSLQSNVKGLQTQIATKSTTTTTSASQQTNSSSGMFESFMSFCSSNGNTVEFATLTNESYNGGVPVYYGHCSIIEKGMLAGGSLITARYVNNAWDNVLQNQGPAQTSVCVQYKIPTELHTCV